MRIALIAHDSRKELMAQFCTAYVRILSENELVATGVTGKIVHDATGLPVRCLYPGGRGADGTDLFARGSEIRADLTHGGVGFQVGHAGDAARQDAGVELGVVQLLSQGVGHDVDLAGAGNDALPAHSGDGDFDPRTAENINAKQSFTFL